MLRASKSENDLICPTVEACAFGILEGQRRVIGWVGRSPSPEIFRCI